MMAEKKEFIRPPYPHPYIMDSAEVELKLTKPMMQDPEALKEMIREFSRYHAHCFDARRLLSCNIDKIAIGKPPHPWPPLTIPGDCPDESQT